MISRRSITVLLAGLLLGAGCTPPDAGRPDFRLRAYAKVLAAEDTRHVAGDNLDILLAATGSPDPFLRAVGVRALGRLESPAMLEHLAPLLDDEDAGVRGAAANAVAQAVHRQQGDQALELLLGRLDDEEDPETLGVLARSMGRLTLPPSLRSRVSGALVSLSRGPDGGDPPGVQALGVALGMEAFVRGGRGVPVTESLAERLANLMQYGRLERPQTETMIRIRSLAAMALGRAGEMDAFDVDVLLRDPGAAVRYAAAATPDALVPSVRAEFIRRLLLDPSLQVRYEGARALGREPLDALACNRLFGVLGQEVTDIVRVAAIDALARPCPDPAPQTELLSGIAAGLAQAGPDWHRPTHALLALAAVAPDQASPLLTDFVRHDNPFVRSYAARTAGSLGRAAVLRELAEDPDANVQTAAIQELARMEGHAVDPLLIAIVENADDAQLLLTAAGLLQGTTLRDEAAVAALGTLTRLTRLQRQTLRDPRMALLTLVGNVGDEALVPRVEPYIRDSDGQVAELAAEILLGWTGDRYIAAPRQPQRLAPPTAEELDALSRTSVTFQMADGGTFTVHLQPMWAPTNAKRFRDLAAAGDFDGLTLHRVVPNFIVQGGSPGANEYAGHGAFTRDEVGLPVQWRGTVGLSTRGRDTGDGQFYVNLVDNPRLDHDYTVFGTVTSGMDVVDAIMEGDVIERAEVSTRQ